MDFKPLSVKDYLALQFPENDIIAPGILTRQGRMIIGGHPGIGKSVLSAQLGFELAKGVQIVSRFECKQRCNVLYVQEEIGPRSYQIRLEKQSSYYGSTDGFFVVSSAGFTFDDPALVVKLKAYIKTLNAEVIILDPLYKIHSRRENDNSDLAILMQMIDRIINELGVSVILIHHLRKPFVTYKGETVSFDALDFRGGTVIPAWPDTIIRLDSTDIKDRIIMSFPKLRNAPDEIEPIIMRFNRTNLRFEPYDLNTKAGLSIFTDMADVMLSIVKKAGTISRTHLFTLLGKEVNGNYDPERAKDAFVKLHQDGVLVTSNGMIRMATPWDLTY